MSEAGEKSYHFNSNTRLNSGSKASMANNEDPFIRALEIQERKREIREQELERQRKLQELENPTPPAAEGCKVLLFCTNPKLHRLERFCFAGL